MHRLRLTHRTRIATLRTIPLATRSLGLLGLVVLSASLGAQSTLSHTMEAAANRGDGSAIRRRGPESTRRWYGQHRGEQFGSALTVLRDLDGDGADDLAIGAPRSGRRGFGPGRVEIRSGRTGAVLWERDGDSSGDLFGRVLAAAGDTDGDGIEDLLVGAPGADSDEADCGEVVLLSGRDGSLLHLWSGSRARPRFGTALTGLGDIDDDGYDDVALSAPRHGSVQIRSGRTGRILTEVSAPKEDCDFGERLEAGSDVDGDGHPDLLISAPGYRNDRGALFRVDLANGRMVRMTEGKAPGQRLGSSLAILPETGRTPTIILGTETPDEVDPMFALQGRRIRLVSDSRGAPASADLIAAGGDADGDGHPDLLTASMTGRAVLLRGCSGETMLEETDPSGRTGLGRALAVGDLDGDGFAEIALGQPFENGAGPAHGAVILRDLGVEGAIPKSLRVGRPCSQRPDRLPRIVVHGEPRLGTEISFSLRSAMAGAPATLLIGRPQVSDFRNLGLSGCELRTAGRELSVPVRIDRHGRAHTESATIPVDPQLLGRSLVAQWVYKDGRKPSASDGMLLTFGR